MGEATLHKNQDVFTVARSGVFVSKTQFNQVKLDVHVYLSNTNYFSKVINDH